MDLEGLSTICAGLGLVEEDDYSERIGYTKSEFCLDNLKDLQRFLRRDDPQTRDVFKQVCKWNTVSKDLIPIIEHCQDDRDLVISAVKVLVFLTMPIDHTSNDISQQIEYLWALKTAMTCNDTIAVIVSLLEVPLENLESGEFTEDDWKLVQLVLTLFRNILAVHDISMQQKASGTATQFLSLRDRFLEILFHENVMDLIIVLTQHVGGSCGYLRQDNLLLLETFHCIILDQDPELIAKASRKGSKADKDIKASLNSLKSIMDEEEDKRRLTRLRNLDRHSQFSGTYIRLAMDGSKTLFKGNLCLNTRDSLLKPQKVQRGPLKRIVWDHGRLSSSKENILELLHNFVNQFLSVGYNGLMQSILEDIEKEHHAIQNSDVVVFFHVAQFVAAFQHCKFLISKPKVEADTSKAFVNKYSDSTLFQGDICGPIAATMNEAMFLLVISKWRCAFDGLKETNDYKFLSAAGSLMKNMIRMLDLVLKVLPEDSKEPQTARILLYKIFYDQTDQGMTQFLVHLIKSFDTHKQPRSDLADLVEMIHVVVRLMENLQARGTLRVSRKSRRGKKKSASVNIKVVTEERLGEDQANAQGKVGNSTCEPSVDSSKALKEPLKNSSSDGKHESISVPNEVEEVEIPMMDMGNIGDDSAQMEKEKFSHSPADMGYGTGDSSEDDQSAAIDEVDFNVSSLVSSTFANNTIIQNLCWLLKFYKSNSTSTNHYVLCLLRRICDDLELSPMLYQLSLLTTFHDILVEQKSTTCKDNANIVSFLTNLVRKMLRKLKSQPLLFVEILFWKARKECHYINSEALLHELGNLKKESRNWESVSAGDEGNLGSSHNKGGRGIRSIADSLGEDEADFVLSHEPIYQKSPVGNEQLHYTVGMYKMVEEKDPCEAKLQKGMGRNEDNVGEGNKSMASNLNIDIEGAENFNSDDIHNEGHSFEQKSLKIPQRKKRLVFDQELETNIESLYEKYKDDQHCNRLIAKALDPNGRVSPVQVSSKLKQLGLKIASKKRIRRVDEPFPRGDDQILAEGQTCNSDSTLFRFNDIEETPLPKRSSNTRKRVHAFSKEQEVMVKDLFEQFKDHKRCSHMIANALDTANTFTAAQVSHKIKQLGLQSPPKRRLSEAKKHSRDDDTEDLIADKREEESDGETLSALKKRSKRKILRKEVTISGSPKRKIENISSQDNSDDEILSSILEKTARRLKSKALDEKLMTSSVEEKITEKDSTIAVPQDEIERDAHNHSNKTAILHNDAMPELADMDSNAEADKLAIIGSVYNIVHSPNHQIHDELVDDLAELEDDMESVALKSVVGRRKLKMVIDLEDDE